MMSGVLGKGFVGSYITLQTFLRTNYYNDLADMRSAIEKTLGSDPAKRAQLGGKLNLLVTALHILDNPVAEASQEEYNALIHLGERVKSAVDLYRAQKASRAASRAATAASSGPTLPPQLQQPPHAMVQQPQQHPQPAQQSAEPFWEMPLEHISSIIAEERKRLPPVPELSALSPAQPSAQQPLPAAPEAQRVNPFMQQALAIAQGLPHAGASPEASINIPPLRVQSSAPLAEQGQRGFASLDLGTLGRLNRSWGDPGSAQAAAGSGVALAFRSGFYSVGAMPPGGAAGAARPTHKRPAAALGIEDAGGESSCGMGARAAGGRRLSVSTDGGGSSENGRTTKYRSVSFDQPMRLRALHSCPEAEFSFWGTAEGPTQGQRRRSSQEPLLGGSARPIAAAGLPPTGAHDAAISPFVQLAAQQQNAGAAPVFPLPQHQQPPSAAPLAAAAQHHQQQTQQQGLLRQGSGSVQGLRQPSGSLGQPSLSLGAGLAQVSGGVNLPPPSLGGLSFSSQQLPPGLPTGRCLDLGSGGSQQFASEALLQQRQRQWQQLLALRLQQQQATVPEAVAGQPAAAPPPQLPPHAYGMAGGGAWPEQRHSADDARSCGPAGLSAAQMILQGLPPEVDLAETPAPLGSGLGAGAGDEPPGQPLASNGPGGLDAGASPQVEPSKRSKHDSVLSQSSPASHSTSGSGVSRGSNSATHAPAASSGNLVMPQAAGAVSGGSGELPAPLLLRKMSDGTGLSIATARLHLNSSSGHEQKMSHDPSMGLAVEGAAAAGHAMSEEEKQGWEQLLMQAGAGGMTAHKAQTPSPPPGLFQQQQQQQQLQGKRQGSFQLAAGGMAAAAAAPAMGAASFLDFMGGQPMDLGQPGQQPSAACETLRTSGLLPLTSSTFDALAVHLQPGQQQAAAAVGAGAAGAAALQHGGQQQSPTAAAQAQQQHAQQAQQQHQQQAQQAQQAAPVSASDAVCGGSGGGQQILELGDGGGVPPPPPGAIPLVPSLPSMFAMASAQGGRASSEPISEAAAMMQAPSLPFNPLDVNRFDSLLFELGPDFLPDFDATAGL